MGGIPMLQVGDWLAYEGILVVDGRLVLDIVLLDVVVRLNVE